MSVAVRTKVPSTYGWSAEGKSPAEIAADIRHTRYRLDADVRALRAMLGPKRLASTLALTGGLAVVSLVIRLIRRRKR